VCFSHAGTRQEVKNPVEWALELETMGAGEILLTSIERDGTMQGYDLNIVKEVSQAVKIPVIASGGAGKYEDMVEAVNAGSSALAAASIFHFTQQTPLEAKRYLGNMGVPIRCNRWQG
jgi:cyclase